MEEFDNATAMKPCDTGMEIHTDQWKRNEEPINQSASQQSNDFSSVVKTIQWEKGAVTTGLPTWKRMKSGTLCYTQNLARIDQTSKHKSEN